MPHVTVLRDSGVLACGGRVALYGSPASRGGSMNGAFQLPAAPTTGKHAGRRATAAEQARQQRMAATGAAAGWTPGGAGGGAGGGTQAPQRRGTDILLTHGPPQNFPRLQPRHQWRGVSVDGDALPRARVLHCFGHIHQAYGAARAPTGELQLCASVMAKGYKPTNPPCVVDIALPGGGSDGNEEESGGGDGHRVESQHRRESKFGEADVDDVNFESPEMRPVTVTGAECSPRTLASAAQQQGAVSERIAGAGGRSTPSAFTRIGRSSSVRKQQQDPSEQGEDVELPPDSTIGNDPAAARL